jgi:hypothetical protein
MNFLFQFIYGIIIPTDELIFFRGVGQPPTSKIFLAISMPFLAEPSRFSPCRLNVSAAHRRPFPPRKRCRIKPSPRLQAARDLGDLKSNGFLHFDGFRGFTKQI